MLVYVTGLFASLLLGWCAMHVRSYFKGKVIWAALLSALPLFLIAALRYDVGTDYMYTYVPYFVYLSNGLNLRDMEPLFELLNRIVLWLNGGYQWVFVVTSALFCVAVFLGIFRESPYPLLSIFLLYGLTYYFVFLNASRQLVGCAILLYSIRYVHEKRWKKFLLLVLIATGFHYSCILFAVVYVISRWNIRPSRAIVLSGILFVCAGPVVRIALLIIRSTPYGKYIGSVFDNDQGGHIILAVQIAVLLLATWQYQEKPKYRMYFNLHILNTWLAAFAGQIVLVERIRWIFGLPTIILIPMALKNIKSPKLRFVVQVAVVGCFSIYAFIVIGLRNGHGVLPYQTFLGR